MRSEFRNVLLQALEQIQIGNRAAIAEMNSLINQEFARGYKDGDRDSLNNVIIYTLSPDAMPSDCRLGDDFTNICKNVAGDPNVINAVNEAIGDAAAFQREDISHNRTTNKRFVIQDFEKEIAALTGKLYPLDFTAEFVHALAACDREFLEMIAHDSMNSSDEIPNGPRAEYLYKRCLSNGGKQTLFAPYLLAEVVQVVAANDQKLIATGTNEIRKDMQTEHDGSGFEHLLETLSGKTYPEDFSAEFVALKAACDQAMLDEWAAGAEDLPEFDYDEAKMYLETCMENYPFASFGRDFVKVFSAECTI